eukprot:CAMPEP_0185476058 /NCGR_PEP_ID=MMETSP1366-20130426/3046_1 /TAXON_ID=38817 /ORGANISM="Gephyrocapsa oceanica, Strain RCC1303" /LENGTH=41 /DNA_ID= /DNA_START= /DNA_END= /DNA_ORIENTATION=
MNKAHTRPPTPGQWLRATSHCLINNEQGAPAPSDAAQAGLA